MTRLAISYRTRPHTSRYNTTTDLFRTQYQTQPTMTTVSEQQPQQQPSPSVLTVLSLLDTYAVVHEQGNTFQKQSFWNLHKARHRKTGGLLANNTVKASYAREELRARSILLKENKDGTVEAEPDLVDNDDNGDDQKDSCLTEAPKRFVLVDAVEQKREAEKENASTATTPSDTSTANDNAAAAGMRNRKKASSQQQAADDSDAKTKWTVEDQETDEVLDEEARLTAADPLLLFGGGLPPRDLLVAQKEAKEALAKYVEAANLIAAIQHEMSLLAAKQAKK
jgi:hypothetical protein